jgi:adenylate cyclase
VQRLQELTKKYHHQVIGSAAFADYSGGAWTTLGDEKLRGVDEAITILAPDVSAVSIPEEEGVFEPVHAGLSDAENVILLHRDSRNPPRDAEPKKALQ